MSARIIAYVRPLAISLVAAAALAACDGGHGSGGASASPAARSQDSQRETAFAFAKCLRDNGSPNFPDPVQDVKGNWAPPEGTTVPTPPEACRALADSLRSFEGAPKVTAADMAKLRQFAVCMREKYKEFPDPDSRGDFNLPASLVDTFNSRGNGDPAAACQKYVPDGFKIQYIIPEQ